MSPIVLSGVLFAIAMADLAVGMFFVLPRVRQEQRPMMIVAFGSASLLLAAVATAVGLGLIVV